MNFNYREQMVNTLMAQSQVLHTKMELTSKETPSVPQYREAAQPVHTYSEVVGQTYKLPWRHRLSTNIRLVSCVVGHT